MRVKSMTIDGFRAFTEETLFDLEGNAVVVVGANGQGKTSFFDALLWVLTGRIPRLGDKSCMRIPVCAFWQGSCMPRVVPGAGDPADHTHHR